MICRPETSTSFLSTSRDFKIAPSPAKADRILEQGAGRANRRGTITQSERDWAYAIRWSEQQRIEQHALPHLRNIVRIITETGLQVYKELMPMKKDQGDLANAVVGIPDSKTPNGIADVPLTPLAIEAFKDQLTVAGPGPFLFPSDRNKTGHQVALKTVWTKTLRRAKTP